MDLICSLFRHDLSVFFRKNESDQFSTRSSCHSSSAFESTIKEECFGLRDVRTIKWICKHDKRYFLNAL